MAASARKGELPCLLDVSLVSVRGLSMARLVPVHEPVHATHVK